MAAPFRPFIPHDWVSLEMLINDIWRIIDVDTTLEDVLTPPGSDGDVIFNDAGSYGADSTFNFDKSTDTLTVDTVEVRRVLAGGVNA